MRRDAVTAGRRVPLTYHTMADAPTRPHTRTGNFRMIPSFRSRFLAAEHDVLIWLPPGYDARSPRRYPVLYLHDGQNLFDDATAFAGEWHVDETAQRLVTSGAIEPLIVVGIANAGAYRIEEYTPTRDGAKKMGGSAHRYGRMIVEELKPLIDGEFRTDPAPAYTGIGGSSLGALVSLFLALCYPQTFGRVAALSPSVWWDNRFILRRIRIMRQKRDLRIWLSTGSAEGEGVADAARRVRDALVAKGWRLGVDLDFREYAGARHNEQAWGAQMEDVLRFLYPAPSLAPGELASP